MATIWPTVDTFDTGSPAFGANILGYVGCKPVDNNWTQGRLHNGYGPNAAAAGETTARVCGWLRRQVCPEDVRSTISSFKGTTGGPPSSGHLTYHAVMVRMQEGTGTALLDDDTSIQTIHKPKGYGLVIIRTGAAPPTFKARIVRWEGTSTPTETTLVETDSFEVAAGTFTLPFVLQLWCVTNGSGDVELTGIVGGVTSNQPPSIPTIGPGGLLTGLKGKANQSPPTALPAVEDVVSTDAGPSATWQAPVISTAGTSAATAGGSILLTVTDDSGSKITGTGRCGFAMDTERTFSGVNTLSLCNLFEIADLGTDPTGNTAIWADDFTRAAAGFGESLTDAWGTVGRNLGSDYNWDGASAATAATPDAVLERGTAEEVAKRPASAGSQTTYYWHQRQADHPSDQVRTIDALLFAGADADTYVGILLRGTPDTATVDGSAGTYYFLAAYFGSPAPLKLYRSGSGGIVQLAEQSAGSAIDITTGGYFTLLFDVHQSTAGGAFGPVVLSGSVDGNTIEWALLSSQAVFDADGNVLDIGDDRVLSGLATGFAGGDDLVIMRFDNWTVATSAALPSAADYTSLTPHAEDYLVTGDLSTVLTPEWDVRRSSRAPRRSLRFYGPYEERAALGTFERRTFRLQAAGLTDSEMTALRTFWDDHRGSEKPFAWDPSGFLGTGEPAGVFRFRDQSLREAIQRRTRFVQVEIEEVAQVSA